MAAAETSASTLAAASDMISAATASSTSATATFAGLLLRIDRGDGLLVHSDGLIVATEICLLPRMATVCDLFSAVAQAFPCQTARLARTRAPGLGRAATKSAGKTTAHKATRTCGDGKAAAESQRPRGQSPIVGTTSDGRHGLPQAKVARIFAVCPI